MADNTTDSIFNKAILTAEEMQKNSQDDYVTLFGKAFDKLAPNSKLAAYFAVRKNDKINLNSTNE